MKLDKVKTIKTVELQKQNRTLKEELEMLKKMTVTMRKDTHLHRTQIRKLEKIVSLQVSRPREDVVCSSLIKI